MQKNRELIFFPTSFGAHVCMLFELVFVEYALQRCYVLVFTSYPCFYLITISNLMIKELPEPPLLPTLC